MSNKSKVIATPAKSLGVKMVINHEASKARGRRMYKHLPAQPKAAPTPSCTNDKEV
jgi:hypothetical protein